MPRGDGRPVSPRDVLGDDREVRDHPGPLDRDGAAEPDEAAEMRFRAEGPAENRWNVRRHVRDHEGAVAEPQFPEPLRADGAPGHDGGSAGSDFFSDTATTEIYARSLHDALPM